MKFAYIRSFFILFLLALFLYANTFSNAFVFDDTTNVARRPDVRSLSLRAFVEPYTYMDASAGAYRPLLISSIAMNWQLNRIFNLHENPFVFRFTNILLHAIVSFLLYFLLLRLFEKNEYQKRFAWVGALIFLFHPVHTEVINSVVNRSELLSAVFGLSAVSFLFVRRWNTLFKMIASACCLFCALLSKESAIGIMPITFVVWMYCMRGERDNMFRRGLQYIVVFFPFVLLYGWLRWTVLQGKLVGTNATIVENPLRFVAVQERIFTALSIVPKYAAKIVAPYWLSADYSCCQIPIVGWANPFVWVGAFLLVALLGVFAYGFWKKQLILIVAVGLILFPFLVVSNLFFPIGTIMAERFLYLPIAGVSIFFCFLVSKRKHLVSHPIIFVLLGTVLCSWWVRVWMRNADWKSEYTLYTNMATTSPKSVLARSNASAMYYLNGEVNRAWKEIRIAESIYPNYIHVPNNKGLLLQYDGKLEEAEQSFVRALEIQPAYENARVNLLRVLFYQKKYEQILLWCDVWGENAGGDGRDTLFYQALAYAALQKTDEYAKAFEKLQTMNYAVSYTQGFEAYTRNDYNQAEVSFEQAMNEQPIDVYLLYLYGDSMRSHENSDRKMVVEHFLQKIGSPYALMLREKMMK